MDVEVIHQTKLSAAEPHHATNVLRYRDGRSVSDRKTPRLQVSTHVPR